ncbi:zeta toxin family protein [Pseudomonas sp. NPDC089408]|uniref:zeta toxin family protein n=1 Tax=Pseudomonas sp. NPDC089408 TaxID=3364465 RepID=UPI0037F76413
MATHYPFTDEDVVQAFTTLSETLFDKAREADGADRDPSPKMLIVAGAQGSGKTYLLEHTLLPSERYANYVRLYLPEYRQLHPHYAQMSQQGVLHAYEHTEAFVWALSGKVFEYAFANRYNIIMETALDSVEFAAFPPAAVEAGYRFEVHMIACKETFSHWASLDRGVKSVAKGELERFLPLSKIEASQANAKLILNAFENACIQAPGSQVILYERGFETGQDSKVLCHSTCESLGELTPQPAHNGQPFFRAPHHDADLQIWRNLAASFPSTYLQYAQVVHAGMADEQVRQQMLKACCKTLGRCTELVPQVSTDALRELSQYVLKFSYP